MGSPGILNLLSVAVLLPIFLLSAPSAANPQIFSQQEKSAALQALITSDEASYSLEEKYRVLRSLQVLGVQREDSTTCEKIAKVLGSSSSSLKDTFYTTKIGHLLQCSVAESDIEAAISNARSLLSNEDELLSLYFSISTLASLKSWTKHDLVIETPSRVFDAIKALGQDDGTWKYKANDDESSATATGIAMEALAGLVRITGSSIDESTAKSIRTAHGKLFSSIEKYADDTQFFSAKEADVVSGTRGSLAATSHVIKGVTAIAAVLPGKLKVSPEKILGIAYFFLSVGILGNNEDTFYVLDTLSVLDANSYAVPLVMSASPAVLSLTDRSILEVTVTTVLGSSVGASVTLTKAVKEGHKKPFLTNQILEPDSSNIAHRLHVVDNKFDLGRYKLAFEVKPLEQNSYVGGQFTKKISITGLVSIENIMVGVLDADASGPEVMKRWNPSTRELVSLFATHLQKLHVSIDVLTPLNEPYQPHQVFIKLRHENNVEHLFLLTSTEKHLELTLDLLALVEKQFKYLSGKYSIELIIGDDSMENSLMWNLGTIELDLPEPPEGAKKPTAAETSSPYGPKKEIAHIFRQADKRAPPTLSNAFLVLTLLPLLGFLVGVKCLDINFKSFPKSGLATVAAVCFHGGIASILGLYVLFWLKLNLFQTLKFLVILASIITIPGYYLLSYLADSSSKIKNA